MTWRGQQAGRYSLWTHWFHTGSPVLKSIAWVTHHVICAVLGWLCGQLRVLVALWKHNFPAETITQVKAEILGHIEKTLLTTGHCQGPDTKFDHCINMSVVLWTCLGARDFRNSRDLDLRKVSSSNPWLDGGTPKTVPVPWGCRTPSSWCLFLRWEEMAGNASASFLWASMAPRASWSNSDHHIPDSVSAEGVAEVW